MTSEAEIIITFIFKRSGKTELKASELYLPLSLELGWFTSQQAKNFVAYALQQHLLEKKKNMITPTFDISTIAIPTGFQPKQQQYEPHSIDTQEPKIISKNIDGLPTLIDRISSQTGQSQEEIRKNIQQLQDEKQILPEVAALLLAKKHNIPIDEFFNAVETAVIQKP
ncbi:MAG: DUF2240 family protein [Methanobacteriota archaeon]